VYIVYHLKNFCSVESNILHHSIKVLMSPLIRIGKLIEDRFCFFNHRMYLFSREFHAFSEFVIKVNKPLVPVSP